jgi:hypothetical protein
VLRRSYSEIRHGRLELMTSPSSTTPALAIAIAQGSARLAGIQLAADEVGQDRGQAGVLPAGIAAVLEDLDALAVGLDQGDAGIGAADIRGHEARGGGDRRRHERRMRPQCGHVHVSPDACRITHPNIPMPVRRGECAGL